MADQQPILQSVSVVDQASITCGLVLLFIGLVVRTRKKGVTPAELGYLTQLVLAGIGIPKGIFLVYGAYVPAALTPITDYSLYFAISGLSVVFLAIVAIWSVLKG